VNAFTGARVYMLGLGLGAMFLLAPAARAQADMSPDHFSETGVEYGPGGATGQAAAHPVAVSHTQKSAKPSNAQAASPASRSAAPVKVAVAVADRKRSATLNTPKR